MGIIQEPVVLDRLNKSIFLQIITLTLIPIDYLFIAVVFRLFNQFLIM